MWNLFYRNTRLLILTISLILVWGLSAYQVLPRMEDPLLTQPAALITTHFPGASALQVESQVTEPLEQELSEIAELEVINSISRSGLSTLQLEVADQIADKATVWSLVRDKLSDVGPLLPAGALEPEYEARETRAAALIVALVWTDPSPANYPVMDRLAKTLEDELQGITGTDKVNLFGVPDQEIAVEIDAAELNRLGVAAAELAQQIQRSDAKVAAGQLRNSRNDLPIKVTSELDSLEHIRNIPIQLGAEGQAAKLGEIAQVSQGVQTPLADVALIHGQPSVVLSVFMESSRRIDDWTNVMHQTLEQFKARLPTELNLEPIFAQNQYVDRRLNGLFSNLVLGVGCVVGCTSLLMGWQSAVVIGLSLPLSVLMVLGGMLFLEIPLHQMSVTGLVIALGLLIDNAVVVVDEVQHKLQQGLLPPQAIATSVRYLWIPLLASNLTTGLAFLPIVLLPGPTGEFVRGMALTVILALFSSLFLALTVIPALSGRLQLTSTVQRSSSPHSRFSRLRQQWHTGVSWPWLTRLYRQSLRLFLARPMLGLLLAVLLPLVGFLKVGTLEEQFFPPAERDQFPIEFELQSQASLAQTQSQILQVRELILRHAEVSDVHWFVGRNAPKFYYNLPSNRQNIPYFAHGLVQLQGATATETLIPILQSELDQAFPSAQVLLKQLEQGRPLPAPIELRLYGPDIQQLRDLGNTVRMELAAVPKVTHTTASLTEVLPKLGLRLDEEKVQLIELDNTEIAQQLEASLEGTLGGSILDGTEEIPVRVRISNANRGDLDTIASLNLLSGETSAEQDRSLIPLSSIGEFDIVPELATISRRNGRRVNLIQGFIAVGSHPSTVLEDFQRRLKVSEIPLPPGYTTEFGGESAERNTAITNLLSKVGVLLVVMIATLVLSFGSFRAAGMIALVGVCSIGLGLGALWLFGYPFGFMAILGTVGLVGVAINDAIVVLAALRTDPQALMGHQAAIEGVVVQATRHVLTTTFTTISGFIPLLLDGGDFWPPLAICIAGGVGGATLLALYFIPCLHLFLVRHQFYFAPLSP